MPKGQGDAAPTEVKAGHLDIVQPWMRATPGGAKVAGGYVRIVNTGSEPDRLVGASIPLAVEGQVHEMKVENGVMKMRPVEGGLTIPPGGSVELKPGGFHLMFMQLKGAVTEGKTIDGALIFAKAGTVPVTFRVLGIGAKSADDSASGEPAHSHGHH